jgi:serine/threonine protein kinase
MSSIGRYEVLEEIGRGSAGVVYLARQHDLDRLVALKALHGTDADSPKSVERFVRESRLAGSLNHPNIVTVYEYFEHDQVPYIAMEHIPRGSLRFWTGRLSLAQLAGVLEGLLAGLAAVEPTGIVHRDLKPENVMVTADGLVKIADFGIAKATERSDDAHTSIVSSGVTLGTPAYMAPEQALAQTIGPWTDLYSVGIMAYEQLVGHVPFHDSHAPMAILLRHINEPIPPIADSRPDLDPSLCAWVTRLLAKDPGRRIRSAAQGWEQLEEIVLELLGARWRRDARLAGPDATVENPPRLSVPVRSELQPHETTDTPTSPGVVGDDVGGTIRTPSTPLYAFATHGDRSAPTAPIQAWALARSLAPRRGLRRGALAFGVTATALLGFLLAPGGHGAAAVDPLNESARTRALKVSLPKSWRVAPHAGSTPTIPHLHEPLTLDSPYKGGTLVIAGAQTTSSTLLPASLLTRLSTSPHGEPVRLGDTELYRYSDIRPHGSTASEVIYAQPTTAGIVLSVCTMPRNHARAVNSDCERILGSLVLTTASPLPLGPDRAYVTALAGATSKLNGAHNRFGARLTDAQTAAAQAHYAEQLAAAYAQAAETMRRATPGPAERAVNGSLVAALARVGGGYRTMAAGARNGRAGQFDIGRRTASAATATVVATFSQLSALGYKFGG